jgi:hypothetical protein
MRYLTSESAGFLLLTALHHHTVADDDPPLKPSPCFDTEGLKILTVAKSKHLNLLSRMEYRNRVIHQRIFVRPELKQWRV